MDAKKKKQIDLAVPLYTAGDIFAKEAYKLLKISGVGDHTIRLKRLKQRELAKPEELQLKRLGRARRRYAKLENQRARMHVARKALLNTQETEENAPQIIEESPQDDNVSVVLTSKLENLLNTGTLKLEQVMKAVQESISTKLPDEINLLNKLESKIRQKLQTHSKRLSFGELRTATAIIKEIVKLRRDIGLLPFGSVDPNKAGRKSDTHQHLHLSAAGLATAEPKKIG